MTNPRGTYRVQVQPAFRLDAAAGLASYLADLGATHLYSAPLLQASPGSEHGYDVVDHSHVNTEVGGSAGLDGLVAALREHGLGLVVDIVPNHAGVADPAANPAWWDVLKLGRESAYAGWFDVDWDRGPLLLPVLGGDDAVSELAVEDGELRYYEHRFPIAPGTEGGTPQEVHDRQHYRLVDWRRANGELTYRRFFAVNELAGLRVEDPAVFEATHAEILRWVREGLAQGVRVDHPDGLRDPAEYLARLRSAVGGDAWLVVEKILEVGEELPAWPVDGTTGYDALRDVDGVLLDPAAEAPFTALDTELAGHETHWPDLVHDCKRDVAADMLRTELRRLSALAPELVDKPGREAVEDALAELVACFPVYRSYLPEGTEHLDEAVEEALRRRPDLADAVHALLPRLTDAGDELGVRFQQVSGATMAKGVEDTAFYRWSRFTALNEVGGDPSRWGVAPERFHAASAARQQQWPAAMTTLSTHDTKRAEDVRARLLALAEDPDGWASAVRSWSAAAPVPDGSFAHLLWQAVAGTWPIDRDRLHAYAEKAAREAAVSTTWNDPDEAFEGAVHAAVDALYDDAALRALVDGFTAELAPYGWRTSLSQKLIQLTMPGIPDVYQGTELWDNSLVDPDNRRPVDYDRRRELLARLDAGWLPEIDDTGAAKLLVVSRALRLRRSRPELFNAYEPVPAAGPAAGHLVGFDRGGAITLATRLPRGLERAGGWRDTKVELAAPAVDVLTGTSYPAGPALLADVLSRYPVSLLLTSR